MKKPRINRIADSFGAKADCAQLMDVCKRISEQVSILSHNGHLQAGISCTVNVQFVPYRDVL